MPFRSKAQWRYCYAAAKRGEGWDCNEWARGVRYASLPEHVGEAKKGSRKGSRKTTTRKGSRKGSRRR